MMKRTKKLSNANAITIDSLAGAPDRGKLEQRLQETGNILNGRSRRKYIASLIEITRSTNGKTAFRKKNFSVVLFVGATALVCALYYTNYYPSASLWTLRLGFTAFTNITRSTSATAAVGASVDSNFQRSTLVDGANKMSVGLQKTGKIKVIRTTASNNKNHENYYGGGDDDARRKKKAGKSLKPSAFDGGVISNHDHGRVYRGEEGNRKVISKTSGDGKAGGGGESGSNNHKHDNGSGDNGNEGSGDGDTDTTASATVGSIRLPNTWDWKYWASLQYWKVNLTGESGENEGEVNLSSETRKMNEVKIIPAKTIGKVAKTTTTSKTTRGETNIRLLCNFPRLNPFDPSITDFLKSPPSIDCRKDYPLVFRTNFHNKLIQLGHPFLSDKEQEEMEGDVGAGEEAEKEKENRVERSVRVVRRKGISSKRKIGSSNYSCCYKTISRVNGSDHNVIFSKRCYPILNPESEIPDHHEFISVRCKIPGRKGAKNHLLNHPNAITLSPKSYLNSTTNLTTDGSDPTKNNETSTSANRTKVYRDMFAFVRLKPLVEDRIRKYEEAKRKLLYDKLRTKGDTGESKPVLTEGDRLSVLVLGLDAQSHMNFIRQMPLTYNFLTRNLSAIGLHGYTKVGDNTFPNVVTLLSGLTVDQLAGHCWPTKDSYFDSCPFIWKKFAEAGYRTSLAEDSVWMGTFNYEKKGFLQPPTDYYLNPLSLLMAQKIGHETWANAKLCYGPRLAFEVLLDYIVKTAVTFRNSLYFQFVWANSLFHDYLNNPRLGDEILQMTLEYLNKHGYFNNTLFILLSDHGIRWGSIRSTYQGKIEERMPLAYFTFPHWFRQKHPEAIRNLRRNAWRLTTPFDVHETLMDILRLSKGEVVRFDWWSTSSSKSSSSSNDGNKSGGESRTAPLPSPRGISLLDLVPLRRSCKMAGIEDHWCVCHSMQSVPANSTLVWSGAQFIVQVINGLLSKHREFCAKLELYKINEAKRKIDGDIDTGSDFDFPTEVESVVVRDSRTNGSSNEAVMSTKSPEMLTYSGGVEDRRKFEKGNSSRDVTTISGVSKMIQLQIVIVTSPGHAVFEATIYGLVQVSGDEEGGVVSDHLNHHWKLSGDISRLNLYGEQSACVSDYTVQKYCYCQNLDNVE